MPSDSPLRIGPFEVVGELGRGGMGVVYRATDTRLGRICALKVVDPAVAEIELLARFRREAQAAGRLAGHPNIVAVYDVGEAEVQARPGLAFGLAAADANPSGVTAIGIPSASMPATAPSSPTQARTLVYLAMDLVEGQSLEAAVAARAPRPEADAPPRPPLTPAENAATAACLGKIARAVQYAHERGVLHRDLKPGNILRDRDGEPRVADFGLARLHSLDAASARLTRSDALLGTPAYMAPEQAAGQPLDARADVYALGATGFACLAGRPPFEGPSVLALLTAVLSTDPPRLETLAPGVDRGLATVLHRCLAKAPADRYPTAAALAEDLERVAAGRPIGAGGLGPWTRVARRIRARPILAAGVVVGVGCAAWLGPVGWRAWTRSRTLGASLDATTQGRSAADLAADGSAALHALRAETGTAMARLLDAQFGLPLTAVERERLLREIRDAAARAATRHPKTALPRAWAALAEARAGADDGALAALRALAAAEPEDPLPHVLRAVACLERYVEAADPPQLSPEWGGSRRVPWIETPALAAYRTEAEGALATAATRPAWRLLRAAEAVRHFVDGARALAAQDWFATEAQLAAAADDPLVGGTATLLRGLAHQHVSDHAGAAVRFEEAAARGWPVAMVRAALARVNLAVQRALRGPEADREFGRAAEWLDRAVASAPGTARPLAARARLGVQWAEVQRHAGASADARRLAAQADRDIEAAMALAPADAALAGLRVRARLTQGLLALPAEAHALAERARASAIEAEARHATAETADLAGRACQLLAERTLAAGGDPRPAYAEALVHFDAAAPRMGDRAWGLGSAAFARIGLALAEHGRGGNGRPIVERAITDLDGALAADPDDPRARLYRGRAWHVRGQLETHAGVDARPSLERARADLDQVVARKPDAFDALEWRASVLAALGRREDEAGQDARPLFAAAIADLDRVLARSGARPAALSERGLAWFALGRAEQRAGADPRETLRRALRDVDAASERDPGDMGHVFRRAGVLRALGVAEQRHGADPEPCETAVEEALSRVLARTPGFPRARLERGLSRAVRALRLRSLGQEVRALVEGAVEDLQASAAVGIAPTYACAIRGEMCELLGRTEDAIAAYEAALAQEPDLPEVAARLAGLRAAGR